jgi:hypothetical protein
MEYTIVFAHLWTTGVVPPGYQLWFTSALLRTPCLFQRKFFLREYYRESLGMYPLRTCNFQLLYQQHISYINLVCINYSKWRGCLLHPLTQSQKRPLPIPGFIPSFNMNCITIELTCNPRWCGRYFNIICSYICKEFC